MNRSVCLSQRRRVTPARAIDGCARGGAVRAVQSRSRMRSKHVWLVGMIVLGMSSIAGRARAQHPPWRVEDAAAWPTRDTVVAGRPDWCAGYQGTRDMSTDDWIAETDRMLTQGGFSDQNLGEIAAAACAKPDDKAMQKKVAGWRQRYLNVTGLTDKQDREAMKFRAANPGDAWDTAQAAFCDQPAFKGTMQAQDATTQDDLSEIEREQSMIEPLKAAGGCRGAALARSAMSHDWRWWIDGHTAPSSEVARVMNVLAALDTSWTAEMIPDLDDKRVMLAYAVVGPDARRMDRAKFEQEIAAAPYTEIARIHAREAFARAKALADYMLWAYGAKAKADPTLKALLFDAGEAGWTGWEKDYATWQPAMDAAAAYEATFYGDDQRAKKGCSSALHANLARFVAAGKVTTGEDASKLLRTPVGYVLAETLLACDVREELWQQAARDAEMFRVQRVQRGPRLAAWWAVFDALQQIDADHARYPIQLTDLGLPPKSPLVAQVSGAWANKLSLDTDATGEIKAVTKSDGGVLVTFKRVTYQEVEDTCTQTNRIDGIDGNGAFIYHQSCTITGHHTVDATPEPVLVPADLAAGLRPGQLATFNRDRPDGAKYFHGLPTEVWTDKNKKTLVVWNGIPL